VKRRPFSGSSLTARSSINEETPLGWVSTNGGSPETVTLSLYTRDRQLEFKFGGTAHVDVQTRSGLRCHSRRLRTPRVVSRGKQLESKTGR
jgi:hypothetical protein